MLGVHLTADLNGCLPTRPAMVDVGALRDLCLAALSGAGLSAVAECFHAFGTASGVSTTIPSGVTGVVLLAESHLAVHTWPEIGVVTLDVYVCNRSADNSARAEQVIDALCAAFAPEHVERHRLRRGSTRGAGASLVATESPGEAAPAAITRVPSA
jgi:S-adenosylmethionine decarboxylase proenzyme